MIRIQELKAGDYVIVDNEGDRRKGEVVELNLGSKQVCVNNGVQEFWYNPGEIVPVPMTEDRMINLLGFEKEETGEGVKFKKGAFRVLVKDPGNYTNLDLWYREDHRHFSHSLYLHELQNHHLAMTKVPLERVVAH